MTGFVDYETVRNVDWAARSEHEYHEPQISANSTFNETIAQGIWPATVLFVQVECHPIEAVTQVWGLEIIGEHDGSTQKVHKCTAQSDGGGGHSVKAEFLIDGISLSPNGADFGDSDNSDTTVGEPANLEVTVNNSTGNQHTFFLSTHIYELREDRQYHSDLTTEEDGNITGEGVTAEGFDSTHT